LHALFAGSLSRPIFVHDSAPGYRASKRATPKKKRG
jgi:hypothetical protein